MDFRNLPIKRKLTWVIMSACTVVLLLTASAFTVYEVVNIHKNLKSNVESIAVIAAEESSAAVAGASKEAAQEVLSNFSVRRQILRSALYLNDGRILARYPTTTPLDAFPAKPPRRSYEVSGNTANIFAPVLQHGQPVGVMYIKWDLSQTYQRFTWYGIFVAAILASSMVIALVISNWLQRLISRPVLELAETAQTVAGKMDYSVRAAKHGDDEIGALTDAFNHMLAHLQDREAALSKSGIQLREALQAAEAANTEVRTLNAELERRVIQRTAELASANHELEAFTYSVSHDLRAPLRHIDGFAQILDEERQKMDQSHMAHYLSRIRQGAQNMGRLVDDLLNLSRLGRVSLKQEAVDLNALVQEVQAALQPEMQQRQMEWQIGLLPTTRGDPGLLRQVFVNLMSNAIKYTRPRATAVIQIGAEDSDGHTVIFIRDNGVGFNMKYAGKIFGVFQRLHREEEFEGTGVGLATVMRIVEMHGGKIWARSELDKGATFRFTINGSKTS